jgi:hypothetical protein
VQGRAAMQRGASDVPRASAFAAYLDGFTSAAITRPSRRVDVVDIVGRSSFRLFCAEKERVSRSPHATTPVISYHSALFHIRKHYLNPCHCDIVSWRRRDLETLPYAGRLRFPRARGAARRRTAATPTGREGRHTDHTAHAHRLQLHTVHARRSPHGHAPF